MDDENTYARHMQRPIPPYHVVSRIQGDNQGLRPLSDIREAVETSPQNVILRGGEGSPEDYGSPVHKRRRSGSVYSIPPDEVPARSSSQNRVRKSSSSSKPTTGTIGPPPTIIAPPPPRGQGLTIPNRGHSLSLARDWPLPVDSSSVEHRRAPSRTFIRTCQPHDILEYPTHRHPRVNVDLHLGAPIFVGGGSIEGTVRVVVDDADRIRHKRALAVGRISVDLLGVEEISGGKKACFQNLATELIDSYHPPPASMVESLSQNSPMDPFWLLKPSQTDLPFMISLPLDIGPPPFQSKHARIRYIVCVTVLVRDSGTKYFVRCSEDVTVLSVDDPEKALVSLPRPLSASDEWVTQRETAIEVIRLTAGIHRQTWVSGTSLFADIHIANNSRKTVKRIDLQLERDILSYKHAAVMLPDLSVSQTRVFDRNDRTVLSRTIIKPGQNGWPGVRAYSTEFRTCTLDIPRGHATVKCGKYFEVRYFLNVLVSTSHLMVRVPTELDALLISGRKTISVQLPILLVHMNSLDVIPNSVAQVAAAIEEARCRAARPSRRPSQTVQGAAFAAPRRHSLDRAKAQVDDLKQLGAILDDSPRKHSRVRMQRHAPLSRPPLRRVQSDVDHHSPSEGRNDHLQREGSIADNTSDFMQRLRHAKSEGTSRADHSSLYRTHSMHGRPTMSGALVQNYPEAELAGDMEFNPQSINATSHTTSGVSSPYAAPRVVESARPIQLGFKKKASMERWLGMVKGRYRKKSDWEKQGDGHSTSG